MGSSSPKFEVNIKKHISNHHLVNLIYINNYLTFILSALPKKMGPFRLNIPTWKIHFWRGARCRCLFTFSCDNLMISKT